MPHLRETGGASDLGRRGPRVQRLRFLHQRLQAVGGEAGAGGRREVCDGRRAGLGGETRVRFQASRERQEEKRLRRKVKAHDVIRAALTEAAARLGASVAASTIELEQPRDPAHGDLATNLAPTLAKSLKQKPRAAADRLVAPLTLPQRRLSKIDVWGPGACHVFSS